MICSSCASNVSLWQRDLFSRRCASCQRVEELGRQLRRDDLSELQWACVLHEYAAILTAQKLDRLEVEQRLVDHGQDPRVAMAVAHAAELRGAGTSTTDLVAALITRGVDRKVAERMAEDVKERPKLRSRESILRRQTIIGTIVGLILLPLGVFFILSPWSAYKIPGYLLEMLGIAALASGLRARALRKYVG